MKKIFVFNGMILCLGIFFAAQCLSQELVSPPERPDAPKTSTPAYGGPPKATIQNEMARATLWLPNPADGYYRGTRFDWSGSIFDFCYKGARLFTPWFVRSDPTVEEMAYDPALKGWAAGINSANTGPVDEFSATGETLPPGYEEAPVGGTFLKIGVGMLRRPDDTAYNRFRPYEIVNGGKWTTHFNAPNRIEFVHELDDPSGYGYVYTKTVTLTQNADSGNLEMLIEHSLRNTGKKLIDTDVCNNTFLNNNNLPTGNMGSHVNFGFDVETLIDKAKVDWIRRDETEINFERELRGDDRLNLVVKGFPEDNRLTRYKNGPTRLVMGMAFDQPLAGVELSLIRSVMNLKRYFKVRVEPGSEFKWSVVYAPRYLMPSNEEMPGASEKK